MAKGFNLTAEINLRGPSNIRQVVGSIRKQLTGINADVNVKISPQTAKTINIANKSFQNFNKTLKQTQSIAAATASSLGQLSNASSQLAGSLKGIPTTVNQAAQATQTLSQTNVKAIGTVRQLGSEFSEFGKQSALAVRRFAAFATVTGIIYQVSNAINRASKDFVAFEQELIKVAQVSGSSVANLDFLVQNVTRLSTTLGVASEDLIGVSRTLTQAGLSARETSTALEALAKSALAPTFDDLNRTVEGSVALMKQFGISAGQLEGALGSINAVAGQFAVEAGDIITAISRTGGVFASASQGVSQGTDALNEFIAVFTSVRATTRESAETIATGLRTIFTRIQRTDTVDALEAYGVSLKDLEGKFVGPYKAVQLLAEGLGRLDPRDFKFSQIVEELGGFRQIGKVIPLIQQFATAQDALRVAQEGQGSLARDAATAQQSLAVQIARVREEFTGLIRSVGQSEGFRTFISLGLDLASVFLQVADAAKAALPAITALFAVKGFKALTQFGSGFLGGLKRNTGFNEGGYVHHFARGGLVPGSGRGDKVPAMLEPGEVVMSNRAARRYGRGNLVRMNKFADGGNIKQGEQVGGVGIFDSDMIGAGAKDVLSSVMASRKPYDVISGPAGSGKSTFARQRFGNNFVLSAKDIDKYSELVVLSGAGATKSGDFSPQVQQLMAGARKVIALQIPEEQVMQQRQSRLDQAIAGNALDKRSTKQLQGTLKAPTSIGAGLYSKFKNTEFVKKFNIGGQAKAGMVISDVLERKIGAIDISSSMISKATPQVGDLPSGSIESTLGPLAESKGLDLNTIVAKEVFPSKTYQTEVAGVGSRQNTVFNQAIQKYTKQGLAKSAKAWARSANIQVADISFADDFQLPGGQIGSMFEQMIQGLQGEPIASAASENKRPFDFTSGIGNLAKAGDKGLFDIDSSIQYIDAKRSTAGTGPADFVRKISGQLAIDNYKQIQTAILAKREQGEEKVGSQPGPVRGEKYTKEQLESMGYKAGSFSDFNRRFDNKTRRNLYTLKKAGGEIKRFAVGGSAKDTVPALVSNGEAYIPPELAKRIGSEKLNRMNQADRNGMQEFSEGGISVFKGPGSGTSDSIPTRLPVGSFILREKATKALGLSRGGSIGNIQSFANGGTPARPGTTLDTIGINPRDVDLLKTLANTIQGLGVSSSAASNLISKGTQISYDAALKAAESDRQRAVAIGASTTEIDAMIAELTGFAEQMNLVSDALSGVDGSRLQGLQTRLAAGEDLGQAAQAEKIPELEDLAKSGLQIDTSSVQNYIAQAARDRKTLQQMDTKYIADRAKALKAEGKSNQEALKIAQQEVALRRKTIGDFATTQGAKGPADFGKRIAQASSQLGIGVSIFTGTLAGILGEAQTAIQAGMNAALASGGATFGASQVASGAIVELLPTDRLKAFGGAIGLGVSALAALGSAAIAAANAAREFRINEQFKKAETASEQVAEAFAKLEKDANSINIQSAIEDKLVQAGEALSRGLAIQNNTAKVFWANAIDVVSSGVGQTGEERSRSIQESAQRSEILEKDGFFAYLRSLGDDQFRESRTRARLPEKAQASAQQFKPVADNINKLIEQRLGKGESVADILADADFDSFANSLAMADQATNQRIQAIMADTSLSNEVRDSRIKNIRSIYAETQVRRQAAQQARQKEIDALETSTARYTNSLERMYTNMEQSINAVAASLNRMNSQIDTTIASLQGQAKIGDVILDAINVLQNPRAYRSPEVQAATTSAASMFGSEASNMAGLINLGENIEASVFSSINRTLEKAASQGRRASNAQIETDIEAGVQNTLQGLGLPPELADKLANEVRAALKDITKDTEGDFDFAEISEKIAGLGSVIQSSARAREVAIKALEAYNAALNSYTQNVNKIIDIEISSRTYARKSLDILSNSALDLSKALGRSISVSDVLNKRNKEIARQTGGPVSATDIFDQIQKLERDRVSQQAGVDTTAAMGIAGANQFVEFNNRLKDTSIGLRENIAALKSMAENTEVASTALNKIQEAQQRNASQVGFLEKIVSSTPEELESTNRAFARLQNNMNGQINTINNSVGAQKAYYEALQSGASQFEAMRAAQGAFARERGETLGVLQDILPFLGDSEQAGGIRANVLESMLKESGVGVSPVFQQILNTLRNPQADPAVAAAIQQYKQANAAQAQANKLLGNLEGKLAQDIATQNEKSFKNALQQTIINFENAKLNDIASGIQQIVQNTAINNQPNNPPNNPAPGVTLSTGGVVYAQTGTEIFKPKGTDTVPAMLTPGEFVVNRTSAQANLPLLKQINSGYYAAGGEVGTSWHRAANPIPFTRRNQITKEKYLDLDSFDARNSEQYVALPSVLHMVPEDTRYYPPNLGDALSYQALEKTGKVNFGFVPGIATIAERRTYTGGGAQYGPATPVEYTAFLVKYQDNNSDKYKSIDDQASFSVLSTSKTRQLSAEELDDYKKKLRPLRNQSFVDPDYLKDVSSKSLSNIPTTANATATATSYDPNIQSNKAYLGLVTPETLMSLKDSIRNVDTSMPAYKQWKVSGDGPLKKDVLSIGQPSFVNAGDTRNNPQLATNATYASRPFDPSIIQTSRSIKELSDKHKIAYDAYVKSKDLLTKKPDMEGGEISPIYEKLTNLFNGLTPFETFSDGKIFNDYSRIATNAKSSLLTVVADRGLASLVKKRGEMAQKAHAKGVDIKGHYGHLSLPKSPVTSNRTFDVVTLSTTPKKRKDFSWFAGVSQTELGKEFDELQAEALQKNASDDGINKIGGLITQTLKFPVNIGGEQKGFQAQVQYREYRGQLYDANTGEYDGKQFITHLPWKTDGKNNLFANITQELDWLAFDRMLPQNQSPVVINAGIQKKITDYYNSITGQKQDPNNIFNNKNQNHEAALAKTKAIMKPSLLKLPKSSSNLPVFLDKLNTGQNVRIGDVFVENIKRLAAEAAAPGQKIAETVGLPEQGDQLDDSLFAEVTKKLVKGGLQIFGRRNFRGVSQFLARNLGRIPNNPRIDTQEEAKQTAGFASNIFGRVGNEASNVMTKTRNARLFQAFKDAWVLASGGSAAFNNIAAGSTEIINDFFRYAGNDLPLAAVEGLFRALGAPIASEQLLSKTVSKQGIKKLEQELQNGKIATALEDGTIEYNPMLDTIQKGLDVRGLSQILFNPYNAFPSTKTRTNLLNIFQSDLQNATLPNSRIPFFDPNTYNWIASGMNTLKQWYGGTRGWFGQDYIFDKQANPNDNDRAQALAAQFAGIANLYRQAQAVNAAFGVKARFGNLPNAQWFLARARAGADPQTLATGGIVYASTGGQMVNFQPKGTDTVPAMLTPGEFVVNRQATQQNLPLLKAINRGTKAYSRGGVVNYLQDGGIATETTKYSQGVPITRENKTVKNIQRLVLSDELYNQKYTRDTRQARALLSSIQNDTRYASAGISQLERGLLPAGGYASGGVVYAKNGQYVNYQSKGTDTVPAMLTPGEFVINKEATRKNLSLLTSINEGKYANGSYFANGGKVDVQQKEQLDAQMQILVTKLKNHTSGSQGTEKLKAAAAENLGVVDIGTGFIDKPGATASYNANIDQSDKKDKKDKKPRIMRKARIRFSEQHMGAPTVRHEYAHAFANSSHAALLSPLVNDKIVNELQNSDYQTLGDTLYTIDKLMAMPHELFATLASINQSIGPASNQFLSESMRALGYSKGGVVYAQNGVRASKEDELFARLQAEKQRRTGLTTVEDTRTGRVTLTDPLTGMVMEDSGSPYNNNDFSWELYKENFTDAAREIAAQGESTAYGLIKSAIPAAAGIAATTFSAPALGPGAPVVGIAAGLASSDVQERILNAIAPELNAYMNKVMGERLIASTVGGAVGGGSLRSIASGARNFRQIAQIILGTPAERAVAGTVGGGISLGFSALDGELTREDLARAGIEAMVSAAIPEGRRSGQARRPTTRQQPPLGIEGLPGRGDRLSRPETLDSTSSLITTTDTAPAIVREIPSIGGDKIQSVNQYQSLQQYQNALKQKFEAEKTKISEYFSSPKAVSSETIRIQQGIESGSIKLKPNETIDGRVQNMLAFKQSNQTNLLEGDYLAALKTSEYDFNAGRTKPLDDSYSPFRNQKSKYSLRIAPSDNPAMNSIQMLDQYSQDVYDDMMRRLVALTGPQLELPQTLSRGNFLFNENGIEITGIGTQAPGVQQRPFGQSGATNTLRRVPMADLLTEVLTSDFRNIKGQLSEVGGMGPLGESRMSEVLSRPDTFGVPQQTYGTGGRPRVVEGTGMAYTVEADKLATDILSRNSNKAMSSADTDPALRTSKGGINIEDARDLITRTEESVKARIRAAIEKSSQFTQQEQIGQPASNDIRIISPMDGDKATNIGSMIGDIRETVAYYDDPVTGQPNQAWGRVSAIPYDGPNGVTPSGKRIFKIETALAKQGYGRALYDALVEYITSKNGVVMQDTQQTASGAKVWSNEAGTGIYQQPDRYQLEGPGVVTTPDSTGSRYQVGNQDARMPGSPARSYGTDPTGGRLTDVPKINNSRAQAFADTPNNAADLQRKLATATQSATFSVGSKTITQTEPAYAVKPLLNNPNTLALLATELDNLGIDVNSLQYAGSGFESSAFKTGNNIVKFGAGNRYAGIDATLSDLVNIPLYTSKVNGTALTVERALDTRSITDADISLLNEQLSQRGYRWLDAIKENAGRDPITGKPIIFDGQIEKALDPSKYKARGGIVYANNGMLVPYRPKGTDTVPAMLTPGEFVINREATRANLPLLKAINNGAKGYNTGGIAYRSRGGPIQYLADGSTNGPVQVVTTEFTNSLDSATRALTNFGAVIERLKTAFNQNNGSSNSQNQQNNSGGVNIDMKGISLFTTRLQSLITQLENLSQIPSEIQLVGTHRVDVNILGAEAFQNLDPAISSLITSEVEKALNLYNQKTFFV